MKEEPLDREKLLEMRDDETGRLRLGLKMEHSSADRVLTTFHATLTLAVSGVVDGYAFPNANWQQLTDAARTAAAHLDAAMAAYYDNRGADLEAHLRLAVEAASPTTAQSEDSIAIADFMKAGADMAADALEDAEGRPRLTQWLQFTSEHDIRTERLQIIPPAVMIPPAAEAEVEGDAAMLPDWPPRRGDDDE